MMSNSFYYFFSAVPQVLGGILALFGVFIIFKIQSIKTQLFGIGQTIIDEYRIKRNHSATFKLNEKIENSDIINELMLSISRNSLNSLENTISLVENEEFALFIKSFNSMISFLRSLIKETIIWSAFTSFTIFLSLLIIPFGEFIIAHKVLLIVLFSIILCCILFIFCGILLILIKSIQEINYYAFSWDMRLQDKLSQKMLSDVLKKFKNIRKIKF